MLRTPEEDLIPFWHTLYMNITKTKALKHTFNKQFQQWDWALYPLREQGSGLMSAATEFVQSPLQRTGRSRGYHSHRPWGGGIPAESFMCLGHMYQVPYFALKGRLLIVQNYHSPRPKEQTLVVRWIRHTQNGLGILELLRFLPFLTPSRLMSNLK